MPRLDEFVGLVIRSGLVSGADLDRVLSGFPRPPDSDAPVRLARSLMGDDLITPYQARKLLAGATRGFFLGGYRILKPLGEGGMGKVYLAVREGGTERVAIKVLPPRRAQDAQAVARFLREMDLSRRVRHPNLARTLDVGEEAGVHFMVMEYIPGESLYQAVKGPRGGPLRVNDAARLFLKVCDGLEAAHEAGLVHRDVKPSNVMIAPDGSVKVLDLGLARASGDEPPITRPNIVVGTLDYASPEQLVNASSADRRSDLYSLGCTLYFTLAGRAPFEGGDIVNKIFKQRMDDPEPLERVAKGVPAAFAAIIRKLMTKDPADRYQTCAELRTDLARWTDPRKTLGLLGQNAEAARAYRPPAPQIEENDLRVFDDESGGSLRDFGSAEPAPAPRRKVNSATVSAVVLPSGGRVVKGESRWLSHVIALAVVLGLLAILAITLFA